MSGSRKSLQRAAQTFNPRAENSWSKDDSKFGQKMLEKMGWKKGEGIGRRGQGMKENIKIRWKLDNKGLGFSIKEDEWVTVEQGFSKLLSNLNKDSTGTKTTKLSLESTSSSSRSRVHYHKFIRGKDISKYSKKDLSGILGRKEDNTDNCDDSSVGEYKNIDSCGEPIKFSFGPGNQSDIGRACEEKCEVDADSRCDAENANVDDTVVSESKLSEPLIRNKSKKKSEKNSLDLKFELNSKSVRGAAKFASISLKMDDSPGKKKAKERLDAGPSPVDCVEKLDVDSNRKNDTENADEVLPSELKDADVSVVNECKKIKLEDGSRSDRKKRSHVKLELNATSTEGGDAEEFDIPLQTDDMPGKKKATKRKTDCSDQSADLSAKKKAKNKNISPEAENNCENICTDEAISSEFSASTVREKNRKSKTKDKRNSADIKLELNSTVGADEFNISIQVDNRNGKVKKKKIKLNSDSSGASVARESKSDFDINNSERNKNKKSADSSSATIIDTDREDCSLDSNEITCPINDEDELANLEESNGVICLDKNKNFTNFPAEPKTDCLPKPRKKRKSIDNHDQVESSDSKKTSKIKKNEELDPTLDLKEFTISCKPEISKPFKKSYSYLNLDDFGNFMEKVSEFNASTNARDVIKEFEENKEALLRRYRQTYLRKYLEEANESDCRIYSDLNGDELDCEEEENRNECANEENSVTRKVKSARPPRIRHLSKAERIVLKARLLKAVQNKTCSHNFAGSNLNDIVGYGNEIVSC